MTGPRDIFITDFIPYHVASSLLLFSFKPKSALHQLYGMVKWFNGFLPEFSSPEKG